MTCCLGLFISKYLLFLTGAGERAECRKATEEGPRTPASDRIGSARTWRRWTLEQRSIEDGGVRRKPQVGCAQDSIRAASRS